MTAEAGATIAKLFNSAFPLFPLRLGFLKEARDEPVAPDVPPAAHTAGNSA
jgi:hypothetical protein